MKKLYPMLFLMSIFCRQIKAMDLATHLYSGDCIWPTVKEMLKEKFPNVNFTQTHRALFVIGCIGPDYFQKVLNQGEFHGMEKCLQILRTKWEKKDINGVCFWLGCITHLLQDKYGYDLYVPWLVVETGVGYPMLGISKAEAKKFKSMETMMDAYVYKHSPALNNILDFVEYSALENCLQALLAEDVTVTASAEILLKLYWVYYCLSNRDFEDAIVILLKTPELLTAFYGPIFLPLIITLPIAIALEEIVEDIVGFTSMDILKVLTIQLINSPISRSFLTGILEYKNQGKRYKKLLNLPPIILPIGIIGGIIGGLITDIKFFPSLLMDYEEGKLKLSVRTEWRILFWTSKRNDTIEIPLIKVSDLKSWETNAIIALHYGDPSIDLSKYYCNIDTFIPREYVNNYVEYYMWKSTGWLNSNGKYFKGFWDKTIPFNIDDLNAFLIENLQQLINVGPENIAEKDVWFTDNSNDWVHESSIIYRFAVQKSLINRYHGNNFVKDNLIWAIINENINRDTLIIELELFSPYLSLPSQEGELRIKIRTDIPYLSWKEDIVIKDTSILLNLKDLSLRDLIKHNNGKRKQIRLKVLIDTVNHYGYHVDLYWNNVKPFYTTDLEPFRNKGIERVTLPVTKDKFTRHYMDTMYTTFEKGKISTRLPLRIHKKRLMPLGSAAYPHAIESAGSKDGNYIKFLAAGNVINFEDEPGIWVVVIRNGTPIDTERFHTYSLEEGVREAKRLYNYLKSLSVGDTVLIGICGDGVGGLIGKDGKKKRDSLAILLQSEKIKPEEEGAIRVRENDQWAYLGMKTNNGFKKIWEQRKHWGKGVAIIRFLKRP